MFVNFDVLRYYDAVTNEDFNTPSHLSHNANKNYVYMVLFFRSIRFSIEKLNTILMMVITTTLI